MIDLVALHKILATYQIITLLGPFFLLVAIVLVAADNTMYEVKHHGKSDYRFVSR
jgi:hypothetical protein